MTELSTALGTLGFPDLDRSIRARPPSMVNLVVGDWERLEGLFASGSHAAAFAGGFANGAAFLAAPGGLRGRVPTQVEWKGSHRLPGDDPAPVDLRVDHVYLISCKYLSKNLHNRSPSRVFDHLLGAGPAEAVDWYERTAPRELQDLYEAALEATGLSGFPRHARDLGPANRPRLRAALAPRRWPEGAASAYGSLCVAVSEATARILATRLTTPASAEAFLWRLLRIGQAPYFILGSDPLHPLRLRIDTPWDWRQRYRFRDLRVGAAPAGQPQVDWRAEVTETATGRTVPVEGHVEIRWSHGRFAQAPEAKIYLDTPHESVPGYHLL